MKTVSVAQVLSWKLANIWYVSYGSNTLNERFLKYIKGGQFAGTTKTLPGCTDITPPRATQAITLPCRAYFGDHSPTWNGAVAFIDPESPGKTLAKGYLITPEQFAEVMVQEITVSMIPDPPSASQLQTLESGRYGRMIHCGDLDGMPMLTFTTPLTLAPSRPTAAYLSTVAAGIADAHNLTIEQAVDYIANLDGVGDNYSKQDVQEILETVLVPEPFFGLEPSLMPATS